MAYKKWVRNADPQDWVTELTDEDGKSIAKMGVPVELSADQVKELEANGRVLDDSSAEEAKEFNESNVRPVVGADIAGSAPTFANAGESNQQANDPPAKSGKRGSTDQDNS